MHLKELGIRIQLAREEKNMSQEQLARLLGCSQSALSNYEKGKRRMYLAHLEKLSEVLEKPIEYFAESLTTTPASPAPPPQVHSASNSQLPGVVTKLFSLNQDQLQAVDMFIDFLTWKGSRKEHTHEPSTGPNPNRTRGNGQGSS